jgi:hypothetical protein
LREKKEGKVSSRIIDHDGESDKESFYYFTVESSERAVLSQLLVMKVVHVERCYQRYRCRNGFGSCRVQKKTAGAYAVNARSSAACTQSKGGTALE